MEHDVIMVRANLLKRTLAREENYNYIQHPYCIHPGCIPMDAVYSLRWAPGRGTFEPNLACLVPP